MRGEDAKYPCELRIKSAVENGPFVVVTLSLAWHGQAPQSDKGEVQVGALIDPGSVVPISVDMFSLKRGFLLGSASKGMARMTSALEIKDSSGKARTALLTAFFPESDSSVDFRKSGEHFVLIQLQFNPVSGLPSITPEGLLSVVLFEEKPPTQDKASVRSYEQLSNVASWPLHPKEGTR